MFSQKTFGLCGLKHHIVEIRDHVTMRDGRTNKQGKIVLLSQWTLEAEFRKYRFFCIYTYHVRTTHRHAADVINDSPAALQVKRVKDKFDLNQPNTLINDM